METLSRQISDAFVKRSNKIVDSTGKGWAKLYIGQEADSDKYDAFFGPRDEENRFKRPFRFRRIDLKKYLLTVRFEYRSQIIRQYKDVSDERWNELYDEVESIDEDLLTYRLKHDTTQGRYYVEKVDKNADWIFFQFIRRCALPRISEIVFRKSDDPDDPILTELRLKSDLNELVRTRREPDKRREEAPEHSSQVQEAIRAYEEELDEEEIDRYRDRFYELKSEFDELFGTEKAIREELDPESFAAFLNAVDGRGGRDDTGVLSVGMPVSSDPDTGTGRALHEDFPVLRDALVVLLHGDDPIEDRINEVLKHSNEVRRFISEELHVISILLCFADPENHSGVNKLSVKRQKLDAARALPDVPDEATPGNRFATFESALLRLPDAYETDLEWDFAIRVEFWFSQAFEEFLERTTERTISTGDLQARLRDLDLMFPEELLANYILALQTKGLVILTGISGTGKSQLALQAAPLLAGYEEAASGEVVTPIAVRPDWTDSRGLLGYHNPITAFYKTPQFLLDLLDARDEELKARRQDRRPEPFFVLLDEMNLARVEHYFAEFLSGMESGEPIELHNHPALETGSEQAQPVPRRLNVPENLFFTGTVNIDETTHMFSPKVLDRAFTIEFNIVNLASYGEEESDTESWQGVQLTLDRVPIPLHRDSPPSRRDWNELGNLEGGEMKESLVSLKAALEEYSLHFGYRVANEISRFVLLANEQLSEDSSEQRWAAFDIAVLQKILPKFNGTEELREPLLRLFGFSLTCEPKAAQRSVRQLLDVWTVRHGRLLKKRTDGDEEDEEESPRLPRTGAKVLGMLRRLEAHGFTSFME